MSTSNESIFNYQNVECVAPFSSLFVNNAGQGYPCCVYNNEKNKLIDLDQTVISNFNNINSSSRIDFLDYQRNFDLYKDCHGCTSLDRNSFTQKTSQNLRAKSTIDYIKTPTLTSLHLKFSNLCNFACRMCDPYSSNLLADDLRYSGPGYDSLRKNNKAVIKYINKESVFYKSIFDCLPNLNHLWFSGGETLLQEEVWEILNYLATSGYSKNIELQLNTNGSIKLNQQELKVLDSFGNLNLQISIDGIGKLAEYIRTNLVWEKWIANFDEYKDKLGHHSGFSVSIAISTFNIHKIKEIADFFELEKKVPVHFNFVVGPIDSTVGYNISEKAKQHLIEIYTTTRYHRKDEIFSFIRNHPKINVNFLTDLIDARDNYLIERNIYKNFRPFRDVEPEWYNILKG